MFYIILNIEMYEFEIPYCIFVPYFIHLGVGYIRRQVIDTD